MDMLIHGLAQPRSQTPHCAELYCVFLASASWMSKKKLFQPWPITLSKFLEIQKMEIPKLMWRLNTSLDENGPLISLSYYIVAWCPRQVNEG